MEKENQKKVLIVEDDKKRCVEYQKAFGKSGCLSEVCHDGHEGIVRASKEKPDLILLDINMPEMSGVEVLEKLKKKMPNHPPVVVCSNSSESGIEDKCLGLGAVRFLNKMLNSPDDVAQKCIRCV